MDPNVCGENGVTFLKGLDIVDKLGVKVCLGPGPISFDPNRGEDGEYVVNTFNLRFSSDGGPAKLQDICEAAYAKFDTLDPSQFTQYCRDMISLGGNPNGVEEFLQFMVTPSGDVSVQLPDGTSELVPLEEFISNTLNQLEKILATQEANQQLIMAGVGLIVAIIATGYLEYKYHLITKAGVLLVSAISSLRSVVPKK